ncbi:hypothetical protein [Nocardiopsis sp. NPDC006938]|uniref:hypothetical protein n=1 Tax=Nocardiopsis sp. NPDC006938 TaxID=3364337 RepID=UPI0036A2EA78
MGLFTRRPEPQPTPAPVMPLTGTDIDQITASVRRASDKATIEVLHGHLQVRDLLAGMISTRLAANGYSISAPDPYSFVVLGWRPTPGQALTVTEIDERVDLLLKMRQQAVDTNHLTHAE